MDDPVVANVGGVEITAGRAISIMSSLAANASTANQQQKTQKQPSSSTSALTTVLRLSNTSLKAVVSFLTEMLSLEYRPWSQFFNVSKFRKPQV
jgi:hypothetical protein